MGSSCDASHGLENYFPPSLAEEGKSSPNREVISSQQIALDSSPQKSAPSAPEAWPSKDASLQSAYVTVPLYRDLPSERSVSRQSAQENQPFEAYPLQQCSPIQRSPNGSSLDAAQLFMDSASSLGLECLTKEELLDLLEVSRLFNQTLNTSETARTVLKETVRLLDCDFAILYVFDLEKESLCAYPYRGELKSASSHFGLYEHITKFDYPRRVHQQSITHLNTSSFDISTILPPVHGYACTSLLTVPLKHPSLKHPAALLAVNKKPKEGVWGSHLSEQAYSAETKHHTAAHQRRNKEHQKKEAKKNETKMNCTTNNVETKKHSSDSYLLGFFKSTQSKSVTKLEAAKTAPDRNSTEHSGSFLPSRLKLGKKDMHISNESVSDKSEYRTRAKMGIKKNDKASQNHPGSESAKAETESCSRSLEVHSRARSQTEGFPLMVEKLAANQKGEKGQTEATQSNSERMHQSDLAERERSLSKNDTHKREDTLEGSNITLSTALANCEAHVDSRQTSCNSFDEFCDKDEVIINYIATVAASALGNCEVYRECMNSRSRADALLNLVASMGSDLSIQSALLSLTSHASQLIRAEHCTVFLVNQCRTFLWSLSSDSGKEIRVPMAYGPAGLCASSGQIVLSENLETDGRFISKTPRRSETGPQKGLPKGGAGGRVTGKIASNGRNPIATNTGSNTGKSAQETDDKIETPNTHSYYAKNSVPSPFVRANLSASLAHVMDMEVVDFYTSEYRLKGNNKIIGTLCVPIKESAGKKVSAVVQLLNKVGSAHGPGVFTEEDIRVLEIFAKVVAHKLTVTDFGRAFIRNVPATEAGVPPLHTERKRTYSHPDAPVIIEEDENDCDD